MYIKNVKVANFFLCLFSTIIDICFTIYCLKTDTFPVWIDKIFVIIVAINIINIWVDYIKNVTKKGE